MGLCNRRRRISTRQRTRMRTHWVSLAVISALFAGCGRDSEEFAVRVKGVVNPAELQSWATNLIAKTPVTNGASVAVKKDDIPNFVRGIYKDIPPEFVDVIAGDKGSYVQVAYGGGFGHWGLYIGYPTLVEKGDENFHVVSWKPGIYFWNGP